MATRLLLNETDTSAVQRLKVASPTVATLVSLNKTAPSHVVRLTLATTAANSLVRSTANDRGGQSAAGWRRHDRRGSVGGALGSRRSARGGGGVGK